MGEFQISKLNWNKIQAYAAIAFENHKCEIGGMMVLHKTKEGDYLMHDPVILKQEISYAQCDIDKEALAVYYNDAMLKHAGCRFVWWHSHHNMKAFWSNTDEKTINETKSADWTLSLVINLKGQYELRVKWFAPIEAHLDTELEIVNNLEAIEHSAEMVDNVKNLCSKRQSTVVTAMGNGYSYVRNGYGVYPGQGKLFENSKKKMDVKKLLSIPDATFAPEQQENLTLESLVALIDEINGKVADGEFTYTDWRNAIREANQVLAETDWSLIEFKAKKLEDMLLFTHANEYIKYKGTVITKSDDLAFDIDEGMYGIPF